MSPRVAYQPGRGAAGGGQHPAPGALGAARLGGHHGPALRSDALCVSLSSCLLLACLCVASTLNAAEACWMDVWHLLKRRLPRSTASVAETESPERMLTITSLRSKGGDEVQDCLCQSQRLHATRAPAGLQQLGDPGLPAPHPRRESCHGNLVPLGAGWYWLSFCTALLLLPVDAAGCRRPLEAAGAEAASPGSDPTVHD